jgi:hypothetical protein
MSAIVLDTPWNGTAFAPPTPLDIATIEAALLAQLNEQINGIEIVHYPDQPESYRLTHRVGAALVRYEGSKYGRQIDTAAIAQERTLEFEITLLMRDLGWGLGSRSYGTSPGAYAILEAVRTSLTGYQISGCSKMYPLRERFVKRDGQGGVWIYAIVFALTTMAVEADTTQPFPLFVKGLVLDHSGITTTSLAASPYTFDSGGQIQLSNGNVQVITVSSTDTRATYAENVDFTLDRVNGVITLTPAGSIASGATVDVAYSYAEVTAVVTTGGNAPTSPTN